MKKISMLFVAAVCALMVAAPARAQLLKWGVKGGVNVTKVSVTDFDSKNTTGYFIGPMAEVTVPLIGLGVDASLLFSQRGANYDFDHERLGDKRYGLDIPVNLKYTFGLGSMLGIFIAAGPDFYFDFSKNEKVLYAGGPSEEVDHKKPQVGINVGAGLKLLRHLQVGVNYNIPMGDSFSEHTTKGKYKTWQISAAVLF